MNSSDEELTREESAQSRDRLKEVVQFSDVLLIHLHHLECIA